MSDDAIKKKEGFQGQKAIVIPRKILSDQIEKNKILGALTITDIGYYPKAQFHYRERVHGTDQHILIYCIEGKGSAKIQKNEFAIKAGEFFIVPASASHQYAANESDPWTIYWVHFKGENSHEIVKSFLHQLEGNKGYVHYNEERIKLFNSIYNQLEKGYSNDNLTFANMSFWYYLTSFLYDDKYNNSDRIAKQDITGKSIHFMTKNIGQMINVEEIAQSVNLSVSHFTSVFKKKTGYSPIEYYNHLKIQKACQYLLFTDLRVKEISYKLGISDPYYFSRLFTKVIGISPVEYKEDKKIR